MIKFPNFGSPEPHTESHFNNRGENVGREVAGKGRYRSEILGVHFISNINVYF